MLVLSQGLGVRILAIGCPLFSLDQLVSPKKPFDIISPATDWLLETFVDLTCAVAWVHMDQTYQIQDEVGYSYVVTYRVFHPEDFNDPAAATIPLQTLVLRYLNRINSDAQT